MRPDDTFCGGGTSHQYTTSIGSNTEGKPFGRANNFIVPTCEGVAIIGWYCNIDLGMNSYVETRKYGVRKHEIPTSIIYNTMEPRHMYIDINHILTGYENEMFDFRVTNNTQNEANGAIFPIVYRFAPTAALNMDYNRPEPVYARESPRMVLSRAELETAVRGAEINIGNEAVISQMQSSVIQQIEKAQNDKLRVINRASVLDFSEDED